MIVCGVCLEEYHEGDLELHQQMCVLRLMFRCSFCGEDYVSKEGLWNHLDQHEIVDDESKELHYQEIKAKHKLHQCVLCNDQRAYSESPYWKHVHDVHDGFVLRCSDCGENFRSEKLKNDHAFSHFEGRNKMEEEQVPIKVENMTFDSDNLKLTRKDQSSIAAEELKNGSIEHSGSNLNNNSTDKESDPTINKLTCPEHVKEHDDSQFGAAKISLLQGVKGLPIDSTVVQQDANNKLKLEIKVEETMLQEQEYLVPKEDPARSSATSLHLHGATLKDDEAEDADDLENGIKGQLINRNDFLVSPDQFGSCSICGLAFESKTKMRYHMIVSHTKPQHKCSRCQKTFHLANLLRRHVKSCIDPICNKCGLKFFTRRQLNYHYKLPRCGKLKDLKAADAEDLQNGIKVKDEYLS